MSKLDRVIAEVESVLEKLSSVQSRLREIKDDAEAVEKARDSLRRPKSKKEDTPLIARRLPALRKCGLPRFFLSFQVEACFLERGE